MNFELYRDKIFELLTTKSQNNLSREAIIEIKELDFTIKVTNDLTLLFYEWLKSCYIVEKATILGKGRVQCIIKEF